MTYKDDAQIKIGNTEVLGSDAAIDGWDQDTQTVAVLSGAWKRSESPVLERRNLDGELTGYIAEYITPGKESVDLVIWAADSDPLLHLVEQNGVVGSDEMERTLGLLFPPMI